MCPFYYFSIFGQRQKIISGKFLETYSESRRVLLHLQGLLRSITVLRMLSFDRVLQSTIRKFKTMLHFWLKPCFKWLGKTSLEVSVTNESNQPFPGYRLCIAKSCINGQANWAIFHLEFVPVTKILSAATLKPENSFFAGDVLVVYVVVMTITRILVYGWPAPLINRTKSHVECRVICNMLWAIKRRAFWREVTVNFGWKTSVVFPVKNKWINEDMKKAIIGCRRSKKSGYTLCTNFPSL